jgi:hypothetical protein
VFNFIYIYIYRTRRLISNTCGGRSFPAHLIQTPYIKGEVIGKTEIFYFDLRCDPASNFTTDVATKKASFVRGKRKPKTKYMKGL